MDEKWYFVTLDHLIRHVAGFGRGLLDIDADDASAYPTTDYLSIVLTEPLKYEPGTVRQYTDAVYYILSRVISRVSGMTLCDFMRPALLSVMRFGELAWSTCPEGYSMGATGLYLRTEDMVKLGVLYLNGGVWRGERIISDEWVKMVLTRGYEFAPKGAGWYGKGGMRGQMLAFNPSKGLAVAWHSFEKKVPFEIMLDIGQTGVQ
jgi:CubicO group peptidase (beta-lactamase class C family)